MSEKKRTEQNDRQDFYIEDVDMETTERPKKVSQRTLEIPVIEARQRRMEAEQNLAPRQTNSSSSFLEEYGRYLVIGAIALVLVIILISVGTKLFKTTSGDGETSSSAEGQQTTTEAPEESSSLELDTSLDLTQDEEVKKLMEDYYKALVACDLDTVHSLVEDDSQYTLENLQKKREYIEDYLNVTCYTKPGLYEGEYILYVYSEIKFMNIDTAAPQLNHYYLNRSDDGKLQMANGVLTGEKVDYMTEADQDQDVQDLIDDVYARLTTAMNSDEKLFELVKRLNDVVETETTEGESTEEETTEDPSGETFYVNGELFYRVDETVYVKNEVNVRSANSVESTAIGALYPGESVRRTGYSENWSQIEYNGVTAYVYKGNLTTIKPE